MGATQRRFTLGLVAVAAEAAVGGPCPATAAEPPPELMARLAATAARLDSMRTHASYRIEGELTTLDRTGTPDSRKAMEARVEADGRAARLHVIHYTEDGEDRTADARQKAERRDRRDKDRSRIRIPLLAEEQPRYVFDQVETDAANPSHVKIAFIPKVEADDTIEGAAWVDARTGSLLSAGFKLSKTSMFVDYVHVTVEFAESTPLGSAVSAVHVEGRGGILFFRKRFRGEARVHDYAIVP